MACVSRVVLFLLSVFINTCKATDDYQNYYGYEANGVTTELSQDPGSAYDQFPNTYVIWFMHEGQIKYFNLFRDDIMTKALNPSLCRLASFLPNDLMTDDNEDEFAYYHNGQSEDTESKAGFVLHRPSALTDANVFGTFRHNGQQYVLEHERNNQHRIRRDTSKDVKQRIRRATGPLKIIEIFVWSAPDIFRFHKSRLGATAKETEAFLRIWERAIIRDTDLIFKQLNSTNLRLYYLGGGNDRDLSINWYANNINGDLILRAAVDDITVYIKGLVANDLIPVPDHTVVFTRQNIVDTFDNPPRGEDKIAYGTSGSMCKTPLGFSVSMAELSSPFYVKAVAQSIIFAFGVSYFFMGAEYTVMSRSVATRVPFRERSSRWIIDPTTESRLKTKIDALDGQCLDSEGVDTDFAAFLATEFYGELYPTLKEQCQIFVGSTSDFCSDNSTVCYNGIECLNSRGRCNIDLFTGDSTPCNGGLVCRYGDCALRSGAATPVTPTATTANPTLATTTAGTECKCEERPIGEVQIASQYIPCGDA